jgi:hypothetical protein
MPRLCPIESGLLSGIAGSNAAVTISARFSAACMQIPYPAGSLYRVCSSASSRRAAGISNPWGSSPPRNRPAPDSPSALRAKSAADLLFFDAWFRR